MEDCVSGGRGGRRRQRCGREGGREEDVEWPGKREEKASGGLKDFEDKPRDEPRAEGVAGRGA